MTPIEAVRDPETNELIGYRDAELDYEWEGFGAVDLIVAVVYRNGGASATYNCTTDPQANMYLMCRFPLSLLNSISMCRLCLKTALSPPTKLRP